MLSFKRRRKADWQRRRVSQGTIPGCGMPGSDNRRDRSIGRLCRLRAR
jgi:hypothetical protein